MFEIQQISVGIDDSTDVELPGYLTESKAGGYVAYVELFFESYVRTLTYSILAYVNKNRIRSRQDEIRIII